jgi:dihydroorotate dehydrogenase
VAAVKAQRDRMHWPGGPPPLLVKVAPDLTPDEMKVNNSTNSAC